MKKDFVSFVVPVFNEEENIEKIANRLVQVGRKKFYEFEVILVNDNSTDNTYAIMQKLKKIDKIAYIRFASVYREFADLESFEKELDKLLKRKE